jgi:excisionase family DNA binding protein
MTTTTRITGGSATLPRLISVEETAELLAVSDSTVRNWIKDETIPFVELPPTGRRRRYRIPLQGLLNTLSGNYDLAGELESLSEMSSEAAAQGIDIRAELRQRRSRKVRHGDQPRELPPGEDIFEHAQARTK